MGFPLVTDKVPVAVEDLVEALSLLADGADVEITHALHPSRAS